MRIAVLTNYHLDQLGGAEEALDRLSSAWHLAGHDLTLLASRRRRQGPIRPWRPAYPVVEIPNPWSARFGLGRYTRPLADLHRRQPLDVILASDAYWPGHVAYLFGQQTGVPYCLYSHGSDVMHGGRFLRRATCRRRLERAIAGAAGIACISNYMQQRVEEIARPTGLIRVVPNGWPDEWSRPAGEEPDHREPPPLAGRYVFAIGRVVTGKGFPILVKALAQVRSRLSWGDELGLVIAGDGPDRGALIEQAAAWGLPALTEAPPGQTLPAGSVLFPGAVQGEQKRRLMDGAEIGVCPSIRQEPQGMVVLEMLCRGLPVIASRAGGLPDHIVPGKNGALFETGNAEDLARSLESLLGWPGGREEWARRARESVDALRWSQVAAAHLELMQEAVAGRGRRPGVSRPYLLRWWWPKSWRPTSRAAVASKTT